eukprot:g59843.t1
MHQSEVILCKLQHSFFVLRFPREWKVFVLANPSILNQSLILCLSLISLTFVPTFHERFACCRLCQESLKDPVKKHGTSVLALSNPTLGTTAPTLATVCDSIPATCRILLVSLQRPLLQPQLSKQLTPSPTYKKIIFLLRRNHSSIEPCQIESNA